MKLENSKMTSLTPEMARQIHGGIIGTILGVFETAHAILVARESTNYIGKLWVEGCNGVDEHDYFTRAFCWK